MSRVLVISHDVVGRQMAGPGIRALELARVLAREHAVTLAVPHPPERPLPGLSLHGYGEYDWPSLQPAAARAEMILLSPFTLRAHPGLRALNVPLVLDLYDPFPLESLFTSRRAKPLDAQLGDHLQYGVRLVNHACEQGDFFICAHERQRDWWLGLLQANGRINPYTVAADETLRALIDPVPFGLPEEAAPTRDPAVERRLGIAPGDRVILWGGGIWDWLDPLTVIQAMPAVLAGEPRARLLFPGTRHPNPAVPNMQLLERARSLAGELGLDGAVHFGDWVPYESWPAVLAGADVAVSAHFDSLETRFAAVRSRVLGYIWARLPMVVSQGDAASELVESHALGHAVPCGDVGATAAALLELLAEGKDRYRPHFDALADQYAWPRVAAPLLAFARAPRLAADRAAGWRPTPSPDALATIERLQIDVTNYESGRFIRTVRRLEGWRDRMRGER